MFKKLVSVVGRFLFREGRRWLVRRLRSSAMREKAEAKVRERLNLPMLEDGEETHLVRLVVRELFDVIAEELDEDTPESRETEGGG